MTIGRAAGGALLDRFGRVAVLRASALFAIAGLLIAVTVAGLQSHAAKPLEVKQPGE